MLSKEKRQAVEEMKAQMPPKIKEAIESSGWERKIFDIGRKYSLHIDDLAELQEELELAMFGISNQESFEYRLKSLGVDDETTDKIIVDINSQIFSIIREKIKEDVLFDEREKYSGDSLDDVDIKTMKKAGVSLGGDEEDDKEPQEDLAETKTSTNDTLAEEEVEVLLPPIQDNNEKQENVKTEVVQPSIDPYREPIE